MISVCIAALSGLSVLMIAASAYAETPTPKVIYETIRAQFDDLGSIDVGARSVRFMGEIEPDLTWTVDSAQERVGTQANYFVTVSTNMRQKGAMFRYYIDRPEDRHEFAFNGDQYQRFYSDQRLLQFVDGEFVQNLLPDVQYTAVMHFFLGYHFACELTERPVAPETLRDASLWESLVPLSEVRGEETVNGEPCVVVEIVNNEHGRYGAMRARVFFAKNLAYFPMRYEEYIGDDILNIFEATGVQEPRSCQKRRDDMPAHYFANRSVLRKFDSMGSGRPTGGAVYEVDAESARVNCEISDAFFTIPRSEALYVIGQLPAD